MLGRREADGQTRRKHLEAVAAATGETPPDLIPLPIPLGCGAVWSVFLELNARRGNNGMGVSPIALADIVAWQELMGLRLTPWEIETILHLDAAALAAQTISDPT